MARRIDGALDPTRLLESCRDAGPALLLESADDSAGSGGRSLVVPRMAARLELSGRLATLRACAPAGEPALQAIAPRIEELAIVERVTATDRPLAQLEIELRPRPQAVTDTERLARPSGLDLLRLLATGWRLESRPLEPALIVPAAFSYDLIDRFEQLPQGAPAEIAMPDLIAWLPAAMLVIDHRRGRTTAVGYGFGSEAAGRARGDASAALDALLAGVQRAAEAAAREPAPADVREPGEPLGKPDLDDEAFCEVVDRCKERIVAGDVFQIVPSRTFRAPCPDPVAAYRSLRAAERSPYLFFVDDGDWALLGASPETCLKVEQREGERWIQLMPIAGTRPRGRDREGQLDHDLDTRLEVELMTDSKELAEHLMLVDLARNDVARVARAGTRRVSRLLTIERYQRVMHLVSRVEGQLPAERDALVAYEAVANMGTLCGAPKLRASQLLRELEGSRRGLYGGAVGYLTCDGEMDSAMVIRSALVAGGVAYVRAGAGVVADSVPQAEADETRRKAEAVLRALAAAGSEVA